MRDIDISIDEVEKNFREAGTAIREALLTSKEMIEIFRFRVKGGKNANNKRYRINESPY